MLVCQEADALQEPRIAAFTSEIGMQGGQAAMPDGRGQGVGVSRGWYQGPTARCLLPCRSLSSPSLSRECAAILKGVGVVEIVEIARQDCSAARRGFASCHAKNGRCTGVAV